MAIVWKLFQLFAGTPPGGRLVVKPVSPGFAIENQQYSARNRRIDWIARQLVGGCAWGILCGLWGCGWCGNLQEVPFPSPIQLSGLFEWKLIVGCCRRTKWWTTSTSSSRILQVWPRAKQPHLQLFMFTWINIGSLDGMGIRVKTANDDKFCFYEDEDEDWDGAEVGSMGPTSLFGSTTG